jgi:hypothetical protein
MLCRKALGALPLAVVIAIVGCGSGSEFETAVIRGTVTCNGQPVSAGTLSFAPMGEANQTMVGPGTIAPINPDGTFEAEVVVGAVRVGFTAPDIAGLEEEAAGTGEDAAEAKAALEAAKKAGPVTCNAPAEREIQVVAGENNIDIELVKADAREFD